MNLNVIVHTDNLNDVQMKALSQTGGLKDDNSGLPPHPTIGRCCC
jgi:hypothetical protein